MGKPFVLLLDPGHGASGIDGVYFEEGKQSPDGKFREGDYNRFMADRLAEHFKGESSEDDVCVESFGRAPRTDLPAHVTTLVRGFHDWPVVARQQMVDKFVKKLPGYRVIHISLHCNADGDDTPGKWGKAQGGRMFVRKNANKESISLAFELEQQFKNGPYLDLCSSSTQGSWLRRANFTALSKTAYASILLEMGFMDSHENLALLLDKWKDIMTSIATGVSYFICERSS